MAKKSLQKIIEQAPSSKIVKPKKIGSTINYPYIHDLLTDVESAITSGWQEDNPFFYAWKKAEEEGYVQVKDGKVFLVPTDHDQIFLLHKGLLVNGLWGIATIQKNKISQDLRDKRPFLITSFSVTVFADLKNFSYNLVYL